MEHTKVELLKPNDLSKMDVKMDSQDIFNDDFLCFALKPNVLSQMAVETDSQDKFYNDISCLAGKDNVSLKMDSQDIFNDTFSYLDGVNNDSYYDFSIQDLLNLEFPEIDIGFLQEDEDKKVLENDFHHFSSKVDTTTAGQLPRIDDLENLELSQFIDDSNDTRSELLSIPVPKKSRSKQSRPHGRARTTPVSQGRKRKSKTKGSPISMKFKVQKFPQWRIEPLGPNTLCNAPVGQGRKIKSKTKDGPISGKCSHCEVQESPQWRMGPNTLCNACGIRFRSGRLFPEYRPAYSPTFSHEMHSNSNRKVLEMRRDTEMTQHKAVEPGPV